MAAYKVEQLNAPLSVLGEGPHWDDETQNLYYIDIYGGTVNRYCMAENKTYTATIGNNNNQSKPLQSQLAKTINSISYREGALPLLHRPRGGIEE